MTNPCNCKAEHWQPHAESCPAFVPKPAQCIHIPDGSVVISGELFDRFSEWAQTEKAFVEEIERLQGELEAAEQHVKILTAARDALEPCEQPIKGDAVFGKLLLEAAGIEPRSLFTPQMEPDTSPLTHQQIFSAVHSWAAEIVRLTAAVPVQCSEPAPREASSLACRYSPARFMTAWEHEVHEKEHTAHASREACTMPGCTLPYLHAGNCTTVKSNIYTCGLCGMPGVTEFVRTCCSEGRARDLAAGRSIGKSGCAGCAECADRCTGDEDCDCECHFDENGKRRTARTNAD